MTKKKILVVSGKRKTAIAKATVRSGKGIIRINNLLLDLLEPEIAREKIRDPILQAGEDVVNQLDINIKVKGGGYMGQAEASRIALARAIYEWTKNKQIKRAFLDYDRTMLAGDPRRKESKKFGGPGARAKDQKSYR